MCMEMEHVYKPEILLDALSFTSSRIIYYFVL